MRLKDKVTLVTGAGSGFGAGIARLYASEGAKVVINDINDNAGQTVAQEIRQAGGEATYVHADVASREDTRLMIQSAVDFGGRLDVLVNNAGFTPHNKPFLHVTEDEFDRIYDVNVKAIFHALQEVVPIFLEQGGGSVINTSSTAAIRPRRGLGVYCRSKGADTLSRSRWRSKLPTRTFASMQYVLSSEKRGYWKLLWALPILRKIEKNFKRPFPWVDYQHQRTSRVPLSSSPVMTLRLLLELPWR